ncbi:MAG TPA: CoA pyrophosphatase [Rhodocyclaceae bacterium]|nr:CoA pyrophosphatase [Rhodocyclaceae bacterium]
MSLDLACLRAALLPAPAEEHVVREEGADNVPLTPAAVLFPIVTRDDGHTVLLTKRTSHLKDHPGQISFPGGRVEESDPSPVHTALRETAEEIGLAEGHVEVLGYLPEYRTVTGFRITPVVGLVSPPFDLRADPFEVAEVFEVPLSFLLDPANHQRQTIEYRGALRQYYAMPYGEYLIWGATAGMIRSLFERMYAIGELQGSGGCDIVRCSIT